MKKSGETHQKISASVSLLRSVNILSKAESEVIIRYSEASARETIDVGDDDPGYAGWQSAGLAD